MIHDLRFMIGKPLADLRVNHQSLIINQK